MFAVASGQAQHDAGRMLDSSFAGAEARRSMSSAIKHGLVVGAAATVLQVLLLFVLLYACGVIAS
jgi:hypothetical protein